MAMKYIIVDRLYPVIFSDGLKHSQVGSGFGVTSAGFCSIDSEVKCWGESISLGIQSQPEHDQEVITRMIKRIY